MRRRAHYPKNQTEVPPKRSRNGLQRRNFQRHRHFLRHGGLLVLPLLREAVEAAPPPFHVKAPGTPGRPPTDPRDVVRWLRLKNLQGWSHDETHATLELLPELRRLLGSRGSPSASAIIGLVPKVPVRYLEDRRGSVALRIAQGRVSVAGDAAGLATRRYPRWTDGKFRKVGKKEAFVKLHALIVTRAQFPYFLSARLTKGERHGSPEPGPLPDQVPEGIELGNVPPDKRYLSRKNCERVEARGGVAFIPLKKGSRALVRGSPA